MEKYQDFLKEIENEFKDFDRNQFNLLIVSAYGRRETLHSNLIFNFLQYSESFLKLFLKTVDLDLFDYQNAKIFREHPANGSIDILIYNKNQKRAIIIENKIDDPGKAGQLQRYIDAIQSEYPGGVDAFYLTKYGNLPSKDSNCIDHKCLSYEKHIINWLEECIKESIDSTDTRIKESLNIYQELVRDVIKRDKYMEEIYDFLKKDNKNLSLAIDIYNSLNNRKFFEDEIIQKRVEQVFSKYLENNKSIEYYWSDAEKNGVKEGRELTIINKDTEKEIGSIYLYPNEIYAVNKIPNHDDTVEIFDSQILCNNLSDNRVKALITNSNHEEIHKYINFCMEKMEDRFR